jgi:hypothetical protein
VRPLADAEYGLDTVNERTGEGRYDGAGGVGVGLGDTVGAALLLRAAAVGCPLGDAGTVASTMGDDAHGLGDRTVGGGASKEVDPGGPWEDD